MMKLHNRVGVLAGLGLASLFLWVACDRAQSGQSAASAEQGQTVRMPATKVSAPVPSTAGSPSDLMKGEKGGAGSTGAEGTGAGGKPEAKNYAVKISPPPSVKVGSHAEVAVLLTPQNGYKVNLEYPIELKVDAPGGVKLPKVVHGKADGKVEEKQAAFQVAFVAESAGAKSFNAEFKFSICTPKFCEIKKEMLSWSVAAE